jgi:hypothetical protein
LREEGKFSIRGRLEEAKLPSDSRPNAVLLSGVECWGVWVPDRLWKIITRPGRIGLTHELIVQDSSLRGGDYLIHNAAPANLAGNQGHGEIHDVKKRNEDPK